MSKPHIRLHYDRRCGYWQAALYTDRGGRWMRSVTVKWRNELRSLYEPSPAPLLRRLTSPRL